MAVPASQRPLRGICPPPGDPLRDAGPDGSEQEALARTLIVDVPIRPRSLNTERGQHWRKHGALAAEERHTAQMVAFQAMGPKRRYPYFSCVTIDVWPYALNKNFRQDIANCYPSVKACIDGLVDASVLEDDDDTHLTAITFHPHHYGRDALVLVVTEVSQ